MNSHNKRMNGSVEFVLLGAKKRRMIAGINIKTYMNNLSKERVEFLKQKECL